MKEFWSKVRRGRGQACWVWEAGKDWDGYGIFHMPRSSGDKRRSVRAHRFSWELEHGKAPGTALVCHRCDNPSCVRASHLFLGTARDNFRDCLRKGRYSPKGTGNAASKLRDEDIPKILNLYATGQWSQQAIGNIFGLSQGMVSRIVIGKSWTHVGR